MRRVSCCPGFWLPPRSAHKSLKCFKAVSTHTAPSVIKNSRTSCVLAADTLSDHSSSDRKVSPGPAQQENEASLSPCITVTSVSRIMWLCHTLTRTLRYPVSSSGEPTGPSLTTALPFLPRALRLLSTAHSLPHKSQRFLPVTSDLTVPGQDRYLPTHCFSTPRPLLSFLFL